MGYVHTFTGKHFNPLDPDPAMIDIRDIAHALSMQCRFIGMVREFYSVAEHSVRVSYACDPHDALAGLLHDAPEAYLHDLASPIKNAPGMETYREAERFLVAMIYHRFGLPHIAPPASVHRADRTLLNTEARDLHDSVVSWADMDDTETYQIHPLPGPAAAELWFLQRFRMLTTPDGTRPRGGRAVTV